MRKTAILLGLSLSAWLGAAASAQSTTASPPTTQPASEPASRAAPDRLLNQMLKTPTTAKTLQPAMDVRAINKMTGAGGVAPTTPVATLQREGSFIFDRVGRLTRSPDGQQAEFTFEADGKTLKDPPVVILPNLKLMTMEDAVKSSNRDLRFRVTGMLTEYRGRNYLLLEKVLVPPDNGSF